MFRNKFSNEVRNYLVKLENLLKFTKQFKCNDIRICLKILSEELR